MPTESSESSSESRSFTVSLVRWSEWRDVLSQIRFNVFVREQGVPPELELDEGDGDESRIIHVVARDSHNTPVGTGRLILDPPIPRIGRMAVLRQWRGMGVGAAILEVLCEEAKRRGFREALLHAQTHATPFYYKKGFLSHGEIFTEAGIPHQEMRRAL